MKDRRVLALCLVLIAAGCTSSNEPASNPAPSAAPPATPSVTPPVTPSVGSLPYSAARVSIKPPRDGSFLVRGAYPKSQSNCKRTHRGTIEARYPGTVSVRSAEDGTMSIVLTLPFERYLEGIAEVPSSWPAAALEAQAIAARSYALAHIGWSGQQGETLQKPICATTDCQVYGGIPVPPTQGFRRWIGAVQRTAGHVLLYGDRPADTVYFSTSNGHTYGNDQVFGSSPLPYLRPVVERDDGASPTSHWRVALPFADLATFLRAGGVWPDGARISSVRRTGSNVRVAGPATSKTMDAGTFRDTVNAWASCLMPARYPTDALPTTIPSDWYVASSNAHGATVVGRGWGHGVGLVQWGAYGKAKRGWSADRILAFYYGGLRPTQYPEPGLIHVVVASGLQTLTVRPSAPGATIEGLPLSRATLRLSGDAGVVTVDQ
jgi:stage II sporulation protein D